MPNGYIVAAESDIAVARVIAEGFDLDVISAVALGDDATAAILARAGNVGFVLSAAAAEDANFTALAQSLASQLETAQLILVAPEARAAFPYLPPTWPSMSLEQARERASALCEQRHPGGAPAEEPTQAQPAPPAHVHEAPASEETAAEETPVEKAPVKETPVEMAPSPQDAEPDLTSADAPVNEAAGADSFSGESEALDGALPAGASAEDDRAGAASETFAADRDTETPVAGAAAPEAAEPAPPVADRVEEAQPLEAAEQAPPAPAPIEPAAPPKAAEPPAPAPPPQEVAASAPASGGASDDVKTSVSAPARAPARTNGQDAAGKPADTAAPPRARAESLPTSAPADATAFAPRKLRRGTPELVRIAIHQPKDLAAVVKAARKVDARAEPAPSSMRVGEVPLGSSVAVSLEARGAACDEAMQRRTWEGQPIDFSFSVEADGDVEQAVFMARVSVDDAQIGVLAFTRPITGAAKKAAHLGDSARLKRHKRVFLSYSSHDRETVAAIATAYQSAGVAHFWDRTSLKSGEEWSPRLRQEIERADLFHLCWSKSAAQSQWVEMEAEYALTRRHRNGRAPDITVQMLDGPPWAPHPRHLDAINFDDFVRAAIVGYARGDGSA